MSSKTQSRFNTGPAFNAVAITPADSDLAFNTAAIFIGGAGDIKVDMAGDGDAVVFTVPAGALLPIQATRIYTTDTTATNIVALY